MTQLGTHTWNELCSQPDAWRAALDVVINQAPHIAAHKALTKASHIIWSGCGSPYYLAVAAARITQQYDTRPCYAVPASELWLNPSASIPRDATPTLILAAPPKYYGQRRNSARVPLMGRLLPSPATQTDRWRAWVTSTSSCRQGKRPVWPKHAPSR